MTEVREQARAIVTWENQDHAQALTWTTAVLGVAAIALRIFGLPPISLHGPLHYVGIMDPFCGGTRAMYLLSTGDFGAAATYNPIVFPLVFVLVFGAARAVAGCATGRWLTVRMTKRDSRVLIIVVVTGLIALTVRQQTIADLLTASWPP